MLYTRTSLLFSFYSVTKFCHCLCIHPSMKNVFYSPLVYLNINISPGPTSIMKSSSLYLKEPWLSGTFLSLNPCSCIKWIVYYWIIYCPVRKQGIWSETTLFSHLFFNCEKSFCILTWAYKVDFHFLILIFDSLNILYSVFQTSDVVIIFVHQRGQPCNIFLDFWSFSPIFSHQMPIFPDKCTVCLVY